MGDLVSRAIYVGGRRGDALHMIRSRHKAAYFTHSRPYSLLPTSFRFLDGESLPCAAGLSMCAGLRAAQGLPAVPRHAA